MTTLITTHPSADFDGVAAMVAARHFYPDATLAFSGSSEEKVRGFLAASAPVTIVNPKQVKRSEISRVVLCDTGPDRAGYFAAVCRRVPVHVFDHHPVQEGEITPEVATIEPVGATVTLLCERLRENDIMLSGWEATLMALGIYEETGGLTFASTTPRDLDAASWLLTQGADLTVVRRHLASELTLEQLELFDALAHQLDVRYLDGVKVGVATAYAEHYVPEVAGIANRLLAINPVDALVILVAMEDKVVLVARGSIPEIDLGTLAREFGGGGHPTAASAMIKDKTVIETAEACWTALGRLIEPLKCARDIMTAPLIAIDQNDTVHEAETVLTKYEVNTLAVLGKKQLTGIISRETVQKGLFHKLGDTRVGDVMEADPYTVSPDTPVREVRERMITHNLQFVPVIQDGTPTGCITRTDLIRTMHEDLRPPSMWGVEGEAGHEPYRRNIHDLMRHQLPPGALNLLKEAGETGRKMGVGVYLAGGMVRDLLLGRNHLQIDSLDVDLVVEGDAISFAAELAAQTGAPLHTHARFGTATITVDRPDLPEPLKLDLATARTEFYAYPTALPTVEHSSLKKDLYRRDFTINALAVALTPPDFGTLIDYFGGRRDLKDGHIRVLHTLSFTEDPTRAIRAVRFATRFGFTIGQQTERLIENAGKLGLYTRLSGKRLRTELAHLLSEPDPQSGLTALGRLGVLAGIDPRFGDVTVMAGQFSQTAEAISWFRLQFFDRRLSAWQVWLLTLADALPREARILFWQRLDLPGRLMETWQRWADLPNRAEEAERALTGDAPLAPVTIHRLLQGAPDEVLVHLMARTASERVRHAVSAYLSHMEDTRISLTGNDLKQFGIPEGPIYREIKQRLLEARLEGEATSRDGEIALLKQWGYL